jgi:hypothetical protein
MDTGPPMINADKEATVGGLLAAVQGGFFGGALGGGALLRQLRSARGDVLADGLAPLSSCGLRSRSVVTCWGQEGGTGA